MADGERRWPRLGGLEGDEGDEGLEVSEVDEAVLDVLLREGVSGAVVGPKDRWTSLTTRSSWRVASGVRGRSREVPSMKWTVTWSRGREKVTSSMI